MPGARWFAGAPFLRALTCYLLALAVLFSLRSLMRAWVAASVYRRMSAAYEIDVSPPTVKLFPRNRWAALALTVALHAAYVLVYVRPS